MPGALDYSGSPQCEQMKTKVRLNIWLLSPFDDPYSNDSTTMVMWWRYLLQRGYLLERDIQSKNLKQTYPYGGGAFI